MEITLHDYILNPMGKSNAILSAAIRESQRNNYLVKFNQVLVRENGNIEYHCYKDEKTNHYWFHAKVPSEHVKKFYYDVVFKFYTNAEGGTKNDLFQWNVQFYSNDPAFVYTYVYAFNQRGIFINELKSKMSRIALTTPSKEKNPSEMVGYCKIIYFAYLIMQNRNLNKINMFNAQSTQLDPKLFLKSIENADKKVEDRQSQKVSYAKKKSISQQEYEHVKRVTGASHINNINVRTTKRINKITNVGTTKSVGRIGRKK